MDVFDELRKVFETKAVAVGASESFTLIFDDDDMPSLSTVFVHFWYETGNTRQKDAAGGRKGFECTPGVLQFNVYGPEKSPTSTITKIADAIKRHLNRQQWLVPPDGYVSLDPMSVMRQPVAHQGRKVVWASCTFDYTHRDPSAADFAA